jgi:hypothetical protein
VLGIDLGGWAALIAPRDDRSSCAVSDNDGMALIARGNADRVAGVQPLGVRERGREQE